MSEEQAIFRSENPKTTEGLAADLRKLGLAEGMTVIVHSSLSAIGWVSGGPVAVVQALMNVVTGSGTIVMPTQTGDNSDPSGWVHPPIPKSWWPTIRDTMPAYDPLITPTRGMGRIVEAFRTWPGTIRSQHPLASFSAWGQGANEIIKDHGIDFPFGETSPLARLYDKDAWILLLGVGYDSITTLHLAENRAPGAEITQLSSAMMEHGRRVWKTYLDIVSDVDAFESIGAEYEATGHILSGRVGLAHARLMKVRPIVDFAQQWVDRKRKGR